MPNNNDLNKPTLVEQADLLVDQASLVTGNERIILAKKALDLNPLCIDAYFLITDELVYQKQYRKALQYYRQLIELDYGNQSDRNQIVSTVFRILYILEEFGEARNFLGEYQDLTDFKWLYNDLLLAYSERVDVNDLKRRMEAAVEAKEFVCLLILEPASLIQAHEFLEFKNLEYELASAVSYTLETIELWNRNPLLLDWMRKEYYGDGDHQYPPTPLTSPEASITGKSLLDQGDELLRAGELFEAERLLTQALSLNGSLRTRNSLAYCKLLMGNYQDAYDLLRSEIELDQLNPFGYALMSESAYHLGDELAAYRFIREAIEHFEKGIRDGNFGEFADQWLQFTVIIKAVAGLIGYDQMVIKLHYRWIHYIVLDEDIYQLGVAYFNTGQYHRAFDVWSQIDETKRGLLQQFEIATRILISRDLPIPRLEYLPSWHIMESIDVDTDPDMVEGLLKNHSGYRLFLVKDLFASDPIPTEKKNLKVAVLSSLGTWGEKFGQMILDSDQLPYHWKLATIVGWLRMNKYDFGDEIELRINGKKQSMVIDEILIREFIDKHLVSGSSQ